MTDWRFPAEWEEHESIWLASPTYEVVKGCSSLDVVKQMVHHIVSHNGRVSLLVQNELEKNHMEQELLASIGKQHTSSVSYFIVPHNDLWMRDFGPIFLTSGSRKKVASFNWTMWGVIGHLKTALGPDDLLDGDVGREVSKLLACDLSHYDFASEGGDREFNGLGTLIVCEAVELQRNSTLTKGQIEDKLKEAFNLKKVIWMKQGVIDDQQTFEGKLPGGVFTCLATGGHVDEFVRFVGPNKVILASILEEEKDDPIASLSHARLEENLSILEKETDQDGNPLEIIRLPMPPLAFSDAYPEDALYNTISDFKFKDGSIVDGKSPIRVVLASSYCNFLVTNGLVLIAKYFKEGGDPLAKKTDDLSKEILQRCFPDREIVQIDCEILNKGGGGMHCISQQEPKIINK